MKVQVSPGRRRITISASSGFLDPALLKRAARYWSFRWIVCGLLAASVLLTFTFLSAAVSALDDIQDCKTAGWCPSLHRLYVLRAEVVARQADAQNKAGHCAQERRWPDPAPLVAALKARTELQALDDEIPDTIDDLIAQATDLQFDTPTLVFKLKAMVELHAERARVAKLQRALYRHFASKGIPKGLHCLALRLASEYTVNPEAQRPLPSPALRPRLLDKNLHHLVLITDNVLAASVVVGSTVRNALAPEDIVFHIVTDDLSFTAMHAWFATHPLEPATIDVRNSRQLAWLTKENIPVLEVIESSTTVQKHFYGDHSEGVNPAELPMVLAAKLQGRNPKYISIMNHLRMYLPQVFPELDKVVFLDDDVVVQRDLSGLWQIPLEGKVNGAVETCHGPDKWVMSKRFKMYFNFSSPLVAAHLDPEKCAWAYGMNIFDLAAWRRSNITQVYHHWEMQANLTLWRLGTLPPALIAFDGHVAPIDPYIHQCNIFDF
eukprot:SM000088S23729  [mRNA]  locus=s88:339693:342274:- [translate_table: standard]